jgi:GH24 family phage-related lysozyme (muramidase)
MAGYVALPAFRGPSPLDFSPINDALDDFAKQREKNRLLAEARAVGAELMPSATSSPQTAGATIQQNRLLSGQPSTGGQAMASNAADFIKQQEGYAPKAQWDVRQNSGGYGSKAAPGEQFTREKAEQYLRRDMAPVEGWLNKNAPNLSPGQRTALTSFGYNLGVDDLERLKPDIQAGNYQRVAERMKSFNKSANPQGQLQVNPGLVSRRQREAALFMQQGASPAPAAPQPAPGPNYRGAAAKAFQFGNTAQGMALLQQQQELDNQAYDRNRQGIADARTTETYEATRHKALGERLGALAQAVASDPNPETRTMKWQKLVNAHPQMSETLQKYGVDPNDVQTGAQFLIAEARGLGGAVKTGTTPQWYEDPVTKEMKFGVVTEVGGFQPVAVPGKLLPPVKPIDTGLGTSFAGPGGTQVGAPIPKDVAGREKAEGLGKADAEKIAGRTAAETSLTASTSGLRRLAEEASALKGEPGLANATGVLDSRLLTVRQSTANAEARLGTLKSQIAFSVLQAMRDASKTGGALGAVSEKELALLENNLASLDPKQGDQAFKDSLDRIIAYTQAAEQRLKDAYAATYSGVAQQSNPDQPTPVKTYRFNAQTGEIE